jgi:hypothetical protein
MGQAKLRGTFEERKHSAVELAKQRAAEKAERREALKRPSKKLLTLLHAASMASMTSAHTKSKGVDHA